MLGHLVSVRDEEVLHTVHGGICLCWCFYFCLRSLADVFGRGR